MAISYFMNVPSFKKTAFVVWILATEGEGKFTPLCFNATSEPPCTIGLKQILGMNAIRYNKNFLKSMKVSLKEIVLSKSTKGNCFIKKLYLQQHLPEHKTKKRFTFIIKLMRKADMLSVYLNEWSPKYNRMGNLNHHM